MDVSLDLQEADVLQVKQIKILFSLRCDFLLLIINPRAKHLKYCRYRERIPNNESIPNPIFLHSVRLWVLRAWMPTTMQRFLQSVG